VGLVMACPPGKHRAKHQQDADKDLEIADDPDHFPGSFRAAQANAKVDMASWEKDQQAMPELALALALPVPPSP